MTMNSLRRLAWWLLSSGLAWVLLHCLWVTVDGLTDDAQPADCVVIMGNTVNPDGSLSPRLRARLNAGLALYRAGLSPLVVVSGGLGREGHYEGTAMQRYLRQAGVPATAIVIDNEGNNTLATAQNLGRLARARHLRSAIVVSQFFHLTRTKRMLRDQHFPIVYGVHAQYFELRDLYALLREFPAYYTYRWPLG